MPTQRRPTWDFQPFKAPNRQRAQTWTIQLGARRFATVKKAGKPQVWFTTRYSEALAQLALAGPDAKILTAAEFESVVAALRASDVHWPAVGTNAAGHRVTGTLCGFIFDGMKVTDHAGELTCRGCQVEKAEREAVDQPRH